MSGCRNRLATTTAEETSESEQRDRARSRHRGVAEESARGRRRAPTRGRHVAARQVIDAGVIAAARSGDIEVERLASAEPKRGERKGPSDGV